MGACWRGVILGMMLTACASATPPAAAAPQGVDRGALSGSGGINTPAQRDKPYLILISLDGFKAEYLARFDLPQLRRLTQRGARSKGMVPVFPSLTFPNHYSLVTGLHPGRHGLVSNRFYDPARKDTYVFTDPRTVTDGSWYGGEPIWVTAESQGMVTACFFWPGSEAEIKGVRPTTYNKYTSGVTNDARVKTVLEWLRLPIEQRPHLITLYFSELDEASHIGPLESPQVLTAALSLDAAIGALVAGIDASPVRDQTYLVITSDHGMVNTSDAQTVRLASLLDPDQIAGIEASFGGPVASIHLEEGAGSAPGIRDRINRQLARGTAYLRAELPERFHYRDNPRAGDVIVVMDESWTMSTPRPAAPPQAPDAAGETTKPPGPERAPRERWGQHGWDNQLPSMRALFLITGPGVRAGAIVDDVRNVDVYPMMTELLGLRPAADIDGEIGRITRFIK